MPEYFATKPEPTTTRKANEKQRKWNSTIPVSKNQKLSRGSILKKSGKPIKASNPDKRARRRKKNQDYYQSAEWRAKRKAVFERDGYRCVEMIPYGLKGREVEGTVWIRCPNFGMNINGKQTGKGLVCEESSYFHRGVPDRIDTCKTRCRECDRRLTPLERVNHAQGFRR